MKIFQINIRISKQFGFLKNAYFNMKIEKQNAKKWFENTAENYSIATMQLQVKIKNYMSFRLWAAHCTS